jgi:hypothetical protein
LIFIPSALLSPSFESSFSLFVSPKPNIDSVQEKLKISGYHCAFIKIEFFESKRTYTTQPVFSQSDIAECLTTIIHEGRVQSRLEIPGRANDTNLLCLSGSVAAH